MQAYNKPSLKKVENYNCFEFLCEGSFGKVYKAFKNDDPEHIYALKFIPIKMLREDT